MSGTSKNVKTRRENGKPEAKEEERRPQSPAKASGAADMLRVEMAELLAELKNVRKENQEGHSETKSSLERLGHSVEELKSKMIGHEKRLNEAEKRISEAEDRGMRHERALRYLLHRELDLTSRCEDLQNRLRRNNLRIYQVPEGREGRDMKGFVQDLIRKVLNKPTMELQIQRAHRAPVAKPSEVAAPPRSIIVNFLDFTVKESVIRLAWGQKKNMFEDKPIYFDHDYSPELQKRRTRVRHVIKQLRAKGISAKCPYPAQLKIQLATGEKTYSTLTEAAGKLQELGIQVRTEDREQLEKEAKEDRWKQARGARRGEETPPITDIITLFRRGQ